MPSVLGRRTLPARAAYLWWEGSWSLLHTVAFTLTLLYQVQVAHLTPAQLVIVGAVMEATCFLFEIPTSIVADLYSSRLSALIGAVFVGFGILIQGAWPSFWAIAGAQVVWGIGYTFISGAVDAWITDEVGVDAVQPLFTRYQQQHLALTVVGIVIAGVLGNVNLRVPMLVAGTGYLVLAVVMAPLMPETGFHPTPRGQRQTWSQMKSTLRTGLRAARRPGVVRSFMVVAILAGISSEVFDRLWTAHLIDTFAMPGIGGLTGAATWFTIFALIGSLISLLAMWIRDAARAIAYPVQAAWLHRHVESRARATTISLTSQADAFGQVVGGPPLGGLASRTSIPIAMLVAGALFAPAAAIYARLGSADLADDDGVVRTSR